MTKSYRSRTLNQRCQIAKADKAGNPIRDDQGNYVLAYGGLFFLKVSGHDRQDNKRLVPEDHEAFFQLKAKEMEAKLKARGKTNVSVTPEQIYAEYVRVFTYPGKTYAPPGHPEEFSMIVPKGLCVNFSHSFGGGSNGSPMNDIEIEEMSIFSRLSSQGSTNGFSHPETSKANGKRRKAETVVVPVEDDTNEQVFED